MSDFASKVAAENVASAENRFDVNDLIKWTYNATLDAKIPGRGSQTVTNVLQDFRELERVTKPKSANESAVRQNDAINDYVYAAVLHKSADKSMVWTEKNLNNQEGRVAAMLDRMVEATQKAGHETEFSGEKFVKAITKRVMDLDLSMGRSR